MSHGTPAPEHATTTAVSPPLDDSELNDLFAAAWPGHRTASFGPVPARSLVWIAARDAAGRLVGYVNVVGDGGLHAFVLDTTVHPDERRRGLGRRLVRAAAEEARARGAQWLHVDYEAEWEPFYASCGFRDTAAGLMELT
ncbi:GNAT family N-acetyltransferase [Streptomyces sp. NPDC005485]|uniref:GNAT family N-acetyltransferase n=1 Tax=Streptomyces sp. NPDC005485 TaxID=3155591 RepID=UPI0033AF91D8